MGRQLRVLIAGAVYHVTSRCGEAEVKNSKGSIRGVIADTYGYDTYLSEHNKYK
jgi:hypothetical protein